MKSAKMKSPDSNKYPSGSLFKKLRERRVIETLAAFIGGGWLILEFVHWILIDHYHFPEELLDITFVTLIFILLSTLIWLWFKGTKKRKRLKLEFILIPIFILVAVFLDVRFILKIGQHEEHLNQGKMSWKNSIAVMPFVNISGDDEQEYLCDGLTEELINRLSNVRDLKIPARTSVFAFKGEKTVVQEIGEKLQVEKILEGSVRKSGDQLRISVQLINVSDGYHIWSEQYPMQMENIFDLQDEIALKVVEKLQLELLEDEKIKLTKDATLNTDAFKSYINGKMLRYNERPKDMLLARDYLEEAIRKDPDYTAALAGLAENYMVLGLYSVMSRNEAAAKAREAAHKALELDKNLSEAHVSMGVIKMVFDWDWKGAEKELKKAIALNPNNFDAHREYALLLFRTYRYGEAEQEFLRSMEIDPWNGLPLRDLRALYLTRGWEQKAEEVKEKLLMIDPDWADLFEKNYYTLERAMMQINEQGRNPACLMDLAIVYIRREAFSQASAIIGELESLYTKGQEGNIAVYLAMIFDEMNEVELALDWLERAVENKAPALINLSCPLLFKSLQKEERFISCLNSMGFK